MKILGAYQDKRDGLPLQIFLITDQGEMTVREVADILGTTPNTLRQRIWKYGATDPRVINPPPRCRHGKNGPPSGEWFALSEADRVDPTTIEIGKFEAALPDPFDPVRVARFDRERERMAL